MDANKIKMKSKTVSNLGFKGSDDGELIELAKEYARLRPGLSLKAAIRNYLLIALPKEIERIRNNGGQLTA
jgi:hypothetical protein